MVRWRWYRVHDCKVTTGFCEIAPVPESESKTKLYPASVDEQKSNLVISAISPLAWHPSKQGRGRRQEEGDHPPLIRRSCSVSNIGLAFASCAAVFCPLPHLCGFLAKTRAAHGQNGRREARFSKPGHLNLTRRLFRAASPTLTHKISHKSRGVSGSCTKAKRQHQQLFYPRDSATFV